MNTPVDFPRLAIGSHNVGSGKGCLMNVTSHWNGDVTITDTPACTHPILARVAQVLNDTICTHRLGDLLCVDCSTVMFGYEPLLADTEPPNDEVAAKRLAVKMAAATRPFVEPLWRPKDRDVCAGAFDAAQGWLDGTVTESQCADASRLVTAAHAANAYNATHDAYAVSAAYNAAYAVSTAAYATHAASTAAYAAAAAAHAANAASNVGLMLDTLIDVYYTETGKPRPTVTPEVWAEIRQVCAAAGIGQ